jgi:cobyrinic acid a,c-diamide synthase
VHDRILIAGTGSGCGKTTVTSAVLRALQRRGVPLRAFKCGPDYIDPMFHTAVLGIPSRNLDLFFEDGTGVRGQLARALPPGAVGVMEGVMGFYDGISGTTDTASAAHLARVAGTPAVLVARPKGQSLSLAAMLKGFREFAPNTAAGVILNGVSHGMYPFYREIAEKSGLKVYGYLPELPEASIPERHLGLVTAQEMERLQEKLDLLAGAAEDGIDLDGLLTLARGASALADETAPLLPACKQRLRVAVARDTAFCFYYEDNLDVLRALGAEIVPFSPLLDAGLPPGIDGLYLGGGYPELHAARLAGNASMREAVRRAVSGGLPTIAECGGFLYLHETLSGADGIPYPMAGVLPGGARLTTRLQNFGYVTLTAQRPSLLADEGQSIRAHEFHYACAPDCGGAFRAEKPNGRAWDCVQATDTLYAGFPHLYFRSNLDFAARFLRACAAGR